MDQGDEESVFMRQLREELKQAHVEALVVVQQEAALEEEVGEKLAVDGDVTFCRCRSTRSMRDDWTLNAS